MHAACEDPDGKDVTEEYGTEDQCKYEWTGARRQGYNWDGTQGFHEPIWKNDSMKVPSGF